MKLNYSFIKSLSHKDGKVWGEAGGGTGRGQQFSRKIHFTENLFNLFYKKKKSIFT